MKGLTLLSHPPARGTWSLSLLGCFPNVQMRPLDLEESSRETPLAAWYAAVQRAGALPAAGAWMPLQGIALLWKFAASAGHGLRRPQGPEEPDQRAGHPVPATSSMAPSWPSAAPRGSWRSACVTSWPTTTSGSAGLRPAAAHAGLQEMVLHPQPEREPLRLPRRHHPAPPRPSTPSLAELEEVLEDISPQGLTRLLNATFAVHVWNKKSQGLTHFEAASRALPGPAPADTAPTA